jgi:signal transduction histidine kinase
MCRCLRHGCVRDVRAEVAPQTLAPSRVIVQLRNPLHAIVGAVSVLESGDVDADEAHYQVQSLRHGVDVMTAITNDFLDIHALSVGKLKLREAWTNLRELLQGYAHAHVWRSVCRALRHLPPLPRAAQLCGTLDAPRERPAHRRVARAGADATGPAPRAAGDLM